jgi:hypothetical protein
MISGKGGRCVGLTTPPLSLTDYLAIWKTQPPVTLRACPDLTANGFILLILCAIRVGKHFGESWDYLLMRIFN